MAEIALLALSRCSTSVLGRGTCPAEPVQGALLTLGGYLYQGYPTLASDEAGANPVAAWKVATSGIVVK